MWASRLLSEHRMPRSCVFDEPLRHLCFLHRSGCRHGGPPILPDPLPALRVHPILCCLRSSRAPPAFDTRLLSDDTCITWTACAVLEGDLMAGYRAVACGCLPLDTRVGGSEQGPTVTEVAGIPSAS